MFLFKVAGHGRETSLVEVLKRTRLKGSVDANQGEIEVGVEWGAPNFFLYFIFQAINVNEGLNA